MTDTDLITAGESTDGEKLSNAVTTDSPAGSDVKTDVPSAKSNAPAGSLATMVLPELRALANQAGVKGTSGMRKSELIAAIQESRGRANGASGKATAQADGEKAPAAAENTAPAAADKADAPPQQDAQSDRAPEAAAQSAPAQDAPPADGAAQDNQKNDAPRRERRGASRESGAADTKDSADDTANQRRDQKSAKNDERSADSGNDQGGDQQGGGGQQRGGSNQNSNQNSNQQDDDGDRQGRRGRRFRDRRRRGERTGDGGTETELREDDVVQPVAGILDVLDNYAFVRTSGYLAGPHDVYVSMNMVRKNGLRRGDAVTGAVRVPREGEGGDKNPRQKFNPLVRLDTINGGSIEDAKKRPDFSKLTPLYPNQRLRLETTPDRLTTRVIDLIMPIGKGQRALIVSPPKAGKTTILQDIANAITRNNPECHLMVVLVDERPEEVTDMTRSVKGEVIASTFDRPPTDHTAVAELAIERAKRLVEQGKDVVVLLDSITRLGRAYNNASPASGRILSGGVDSTALYPPKRFLGAARNIEGGGSLTIIATAMVETGSTGDTVIFEEFKGTGNAELKLDRKISERRVFPAVDVNPSGTRKDELLLSPDEFAIVHKLRRVLSGLDSHQAIDLLMSQLRKTKTNYEFLVQVSKTTPGGMDND